MFSAGVPALTEAEVKEIAEVGKKIHFRHYVSSFFTLSCFFFRCVWGMLSDSIGLRPAFIWAAFR